MRRDDINHNNYRRGKSKKEKPYVRRVRHQDSPDRKKDGGTPGNADRRRSASVISDGSGSYSGQRHTKQASDRRVRRTENKEYAVSGEVRRNTTRVSGTSRRRSSSGYSGQTEYTSRKMVVTLPMRLRILAIFFLMILAAAFVFVSISLFMSKNGEAYRKQVLINKSYVGHSVKYKRGSILDRNGNVLAESRRIFHIALDPSVITATKVSTDDDGNKKTKKLYYDATEKALNEVFDISSDDFEAAVNEDKTSKYVLLKQYDGITMDKIDEYDELRSRVNDDKNHDADLKAAYYDQKIKGVSFEEKYERRYPYKTVAADVIGLCSDDNVPSFGLERTYSSELNGQDGKSYRYFNSDSDYVENVIDPVDGNNLVTTIDANIQGVVEQHIAKFEDEMGSRNLGVILMDPNNGEVIAMASNPAYDLNDPAGFMNDPDTFLNEFLSDQYNTPYDIKHKVAEKLSDTEKISAVWKNYCISDEYEPGSTFKPFTVAACLDEGITNTKRTYVCDGGQDINGVYVKCTAYKRGGHGTLNVQGALMESCNDVLMQLGYGLGIDNFCKYNNAYGFGQKTGIDMPGEAAGNIFRPASMHALELATSSFGQAQTVTMIQMAAGFSSLVNGGNYYKPHFMKEIDSAGGSVVKKYEPVVERKTISEKTSNFLREALYHTVEEGTASPAKVPGYAICGKTGTAEKHPTGQGKYLLSFLGCVPKDHPKLVCYVVIDEPHTDDQAHSTFATKFASSLLKDVLPMLGMKADPALAKEQEKHVSEVVDMDLPHGELNGVKLPSTKNGNLYDDAPRGGYADRQYNVAGYGKIVSSSAISGSAIEGSDDESYEAAAEYVSEQEREAAQEQ
jgi:stage V sporulation protein D (sporulation-specific penicillin-binding protein)